MSAEAPAREWPTWETWEEGWLVKEGCLHFEGEDITRMLPPHRFEDCSDLTKMTPPPMGSGWCNNQSECGCFFVWFPFENGWEASVTDDWGVALNPAIVSGVNHRVWKPEMRNPCDWGYHWDNSDMEEYVPGFEDFGSYLENPDHLVACLNVISRLPSDPDEARRRFRLL